MLQVTALHGTTLLTAEVLLDGKRVGTTLLYLKQVRVGRHRLEVRRAGFVSRKRNICVRANRTNSFSFSLERAR